MVINVECIDEKILCKFVPYGDGKRLWIRGEDFWHPTIGWCPHLNLGYDECKDCGLAVERAE